jgi:adenine-specific DNA methylase
MNYKKKLIEVALPLEAINKASAREKSIRHGHPSTLHLWWARRPLAAARAVIFAQMVDDPSAHPDIFKTEKAQEKERQRLFRIIEDLVLWENTTNEAVLQQARDENWQSWRYTCAENADHPRAKELFDRYKLPAFHDPFAEGGSLPLEAQRLAVDRASDYGSVVCSWHNGPKMQALRNTFGRQAIPMVWDFAEGSPFSDSSGNWSKNIDWVVKSMDFLPSSSGAKAEQDDATGQTISAGKIVSTDPPYYDNVPYADLSDFFYIWLRRSLKSVFPDLFATLAVPKAEELVATAYRHGGKAGAESFFLDGMTQAMHRVAEQTHPAFPVTIYYAFKQAESDGGDGTTNTGRDTFLAAVIEAGFAISGTWPMRTELANRMRGSESNALASSIVLVCRQRPADAPTATRREFVTALKAELPTALAHLQRGNIAPVDLAQAAIGPGMAVYIRYAKVLDAEGNPIPVRAALALINQTLDEALAEQEGDFDADSRWALTWFEQVGFAEGDYGVAEQLSKSKNGRGRAGRGRYPGLQGRQGAPAETRRATR